MVLLGAVAVSCVPWQDMDRTLFEEDKKKKHKFDAVTKGEYASVQKSKGKSAMLSFDAEKSEISRQNWSEVEA